MKKIVTVIVVVFLFFSFGCTNSKQQNTEQKREAKRVAWVIKVKPEKLEEYKKLHANPWPEVNAILKDANIRNYSIYYRDGLLFSYLEYTGSDFDADMKKMADNPVTQKWWKLTDPCQEPVESAKEGEWWADLEEVYHLE
jgi:L-rhamnose mutarotase